MTDTEQSAPCDHPELRSTLAGQLSCVVCGAEITVSHPGQLPTAEGGTPRED